MSCNEINTLCGKTMKNILFKYHQKKCNICKGNLPEINVECYNHKIGNIKGKKLSEMTIRDFKKKAYKNSTLKCIIDDIVKDRKEKAQLNE
jgi:hypothetical protein